jgi:hypothetical protein
MHTVITQIGINTVVNLVEIFVMVDRVLIHHLKIPTTDEKIYT